MNEDLVFRWIIAGIILSAIPISAYFRGRAARSSEPVSRERESWPIFIALRLTGLGFLISLILFLIRPSLLSFSALPLPVWLRWGGLLINLGCLPFIIWSFRHLGNNVTDTVGLRSNHTLVTSGPYRYVRHPLYLFGGLAWIGLSLQTANAIPLILGILGSRVLALRTRTEERVLLERFGESYRIYIEKTGRFLPKGS